MNNQSTATNHEWDLSPYATGGIVKPTGKYLINETGCEYILWSEVRDQPCGCDSRLCVDCSPVDALWQAEKSAKRPDWIYRAWLTYYKIKRWLHLP